MRILHGASGAAGPALLDRLSVCALNGLKLRLRKVGSPKNLQYQVRLAINVAVDVVRKLSREPLLEVALLLRRFGMCPQVISNCQLIREAEAVARTNIQVVYWQSVRAGKGLSPFNSKIATMYVAQCCETFDHDRNICIRRNDHADVDDRFGSEAGDGRTAHVFYRQRDISYHWPDFRT